MIWFVFVLMTLLAVASILWPLVRKARVTDEKPSDVGVYANQLSEIDRERERGLLSELDYASARTEIGRRLIAAEDRAERHARVSGVARQATAAAALILMPALAFFIYLTLGHPEVPDRPLASRGDDTVQQLASADQQAPDMDQVIERVEEHLAANPDDAQGWSLVAPIYLRLGRLDDAINAWQNVIRLDGSSYPAEAQLGEALVLRAGGMVTDEATKAFERALALNQSGIQARFFLALGKTQRKETRAAAEAWAELLATDEATSDFTQSWVVAALQNLRSLNAELGEDAVEIPRSSVPASAAVEALSSGVDPDAAIAGMVAGLAARLAEDGGTLDEWSRLVRSYVVMGDENAAKLALADGIQDLTENSDRDRLKSVAVALGLALDAD